ncbi:MAG TPA: tRNA pseudouridine(55) synthase TruB [Thermoanaerobaculia bacterium]|jgi:tRNA pseudouridine55 synthase|nr:tRNA pseudouridine(55) synthase TruB [Thermoanaerobaculia bacterium]
MKDGLLLIDKEPGLTSHDVVQRVRRLLGQKKIGHCGTLDPDATGLLLLTLGTATRLTRFLIRAPKVYHGVIRFGVVTDTYDASGKVQAEAPAEAVAALTLEQVARAMHGFLGAIEQQAPPYSAKKVHGVKLYELARRGEEVPAEAKEVTIYELEPLGELAGGSLAFRLSCSSGTYARALANDLGGLLGVGAHLSELRRVQIGSFHVDAALKLAALAALLEAGEGGEAGSGGASLGRAWLPFDEIPLPFDEVTTDSQQELRISHGQTVLVRELAGGEGDWVKLVNRRRQFIAIGTVIEKIGGAGVGIVQPKVVFK